MRIVSTDRCSSPWLRHVLVLGAALFALALGAHAQEPASGRDRAQNANPAVAGEVGTQTAAVMPTDPRQGNPKMLDKDLSVWGMFMDAGTVAKSVMILLLLASIWNITIFFEKSFVIRRVNRQADRFLKAFRGARSLEEISRNAATAGSGPMARMFAAGMQEYHLASDQGLSIVGEFRERIRERIGYAMTIVQSHETRTLGSSMSVLATVGSTAPFIGLFGTVWGIMTSFIGIAKTQTTNLAVVAPGIAEALLATAIGLAAAIPAVMLYNKFSRDIGTYTGRLEDFGSEFAVVLSRELDHKEVA